MINSKLQLQRGALDNVAKYFKETFGDKKPIVVEDTNTSVVAGNKVISQFGGCRCYCFDGSEVYADDKHVDIVTKQLESDDSLIAVAVGSGTINDLCKRASHVAGKRPYMCVATAPSVDGFTSNGAAITDKGLKITLACPAPVLVVADPDILSGAPIDMISAGYGDLTAKVPGGADWIIADSLGIEKIDEKVWKMVQPDLKKHISDPKGLRNRDSDVIGNVFDGLIATGCAMQEYFDSRPASGCEHLMSHVWEMNDSCEINGKAASHGFKVAIGTLTSTAMMGMLFSKSKDYIKKIISEVKPQTWEERQNSIRKAVTIPSVCDRQIEICSKKFAQPDVLKSRFETLLDCWDSLKERVNSQNYTFDELKNMFTEAGCPTEPAHIGLSKKDHRYGIVTSQMMRNRYTLVDLLYELGLLDEFADTVTDQSSGFFSKWR